MTIWCPDLSQHAGPRYKALAEAIDAAIGQGDLEPGGKLPPQRDLAYRLGVTVGTVSRAYALAEQRGLVRGEVGRGTFVMSAGATGSFYNPVIDGDDDLIKLTVNSQPDDGVQKQLAGSLQTLAASHQPIGELMAYTPRIGLTPHRAAAAAWASRIGAAFAPEQTMITGGAHQAILTALAGLARPGDTVLCEHLLYSGIKRIATRLGLRLQGLALDGDGLCPDALERACRASEARVLIMNPTIHNPTTTTMSEARRRTIARIAERYDLALVEDDVYGQLPEDRPPPFAALAPERTVYITTASKIISPNLRFGVLVAPERLFDRLADAQSDLFLTCPALMAALFTQWLEDGTADHLIGRQRAEAAARQALAADCLHGIAHHGQPLAYHLWLPLPAPWRSSTFSDALRARGVAVDPAFIFAVGPEREPHAIRISLSAARTRERLRRALELVREALTSGPIVRRDSI
ncbi:MAG: PLP-dependent aminotransferase family protein [Alphaproteobacteria bacterium]